MVKQQAWISAVGLILFVGFLYSLATIPEPYAPHSPIPRTGPRGYTEYTMVDVVKVMDGDTLHVMHNDERLTIRGQGFDAPERGQKCFDEATRRLTQVIANEPVTINPYGELDKYGRIITSIDTANGDAGLILIREGLARPRYDSTDGHPRHLQQGAYHADAASAPPACFP